LAENWPKIGQKNGGISTVLGEIQPFWNNLGHINGRILNFADSAQMAEIFNYCADPD
jgi:hypothetical protein